MTSALVAPSFKNIAVGMAGLLFACSLFFAAAPQAHAASLTEAQIKSVLNLLNAFDVDQSTVDSVGTILHGGTVSGPVFTAGPTSGAAPLQVYFSTDLHGDQYHIDFGDGTMDDVTAGACTEGIPPSCRYGATHTYSAAGIYQAVLYRQQPWQCPTGLYCTAVMPAREDLQSIAITVSGNSTSGSLSVTAPASGTSVVQGTPLAISWRMANPRAKSAVALWLYGKDGTEYGRIIEGQPTGGTYTWTVPGSNCDKDGNCHFVADNPYVWYTAAGPFYIVAKAYTPAGAYLGGGLMPASDNLEFYATAISDIFTVTAPRSASPASLTASPSSGQAPLAVEFSIKGSFSGYTVDFGDGQSGSGVINDADCSTAGFCSASHTYTAPGDYTARLIAGGVCGKNGISFTSPYCDKQVPATARVSVAVPPKGCYVTDVYAEQVSGYAYYNLYLKVRGLSSDKHSATITGADSWNSLGFATYSAADGYQVMQAGQTLNGTAVNYILQRKNNITLGTLDGAQISCGTMAAVTEPPTVAGASAPAVAAMPQAGSGVGLLAAAALAPWQAAVSSLSQLLYSLGAY